MIMSDFKYYRGKVNMISLQNVNVAYDSSRMILHEINLDFDHSELVILTGKSGSGKSTLLKCLNGLLAPVTGSYLFQGNDIYQLSEKDRKKACTQKIGFMWQNYRLLPELTVQNNILLPSLIANARADQEYLYELLELLDIKEYLRQYPDKLSGGEQQRVALARALILKPELVLADEPTGALDSKNSQRLMELIENTREKLNTLFIIATHDQEMARIATRQIELSDGRVVRDER